MIVIKSKTDMFGFARRKEFECPKCKHTILFLSVSPLICNNCGSVLPEATDLLKTLEDRIFYSNRSDKW